MQRPRQPLEATRHVDELSEEDTENLIDLVAELVVQFLKTSRDSSSTVESGAQGEKERS